MRNIYIRPNNAPESIEQEALKVWLDSKRIRFFAIPNGGKMTLWQGAKLKRMGTMKGVPDLMVPIASGSYHGLFLELKRERGGKVSFEQVEWLRFLREQGYYAEIAYGFEEAKKIVTEYLAMTPKAA